MPFNLLFFSGASDSWNWKRSLRDDGNVVSVGSVSEDDEYIVAWQLDDITLPINIRLREVMGEMGVNPEICDGVFIRKSKDNDRITLCLVELKGGDLPKAVNQIINTKRSFVSLLRTNLGEANKHFLGRIEWRAFVKVAEDSQIKQSQQNPNNKRSTKKSPPKKKRKMKKTSALNRRFPDNLKPLREHGFSYADSGRYEEIGRVLR